MKRNLPAVLCLLPALAAAEVYRWVDEQGGVHYGDRPREGAEAVELPPLPVYTPAPVPREAPRPEAPQPARYETLEILAPEPDATIRDNTGSVVLRFALRPALREGDGHRYRIVLDGEALAMPVTSGELRLSNLDRGTHTVRVEVVDARGRAQIASEPVTFHVKRFSRLFRGR